MRLKGKIALISGGASGIGAAEAKLFAREGATVVICDKLLEEGTNVENEINETGMNAMFVSLDVRSELEWNNAIQTTIDKFGSLNILVNNAAIYSSVAIENTDVEEWDEIMAVNLRGVFLGTKCAIPHMRRSGGGSIVNISSITGLIGTLHGGAYGASKGGVRLLTKYTAIQHAKDGIRANSIHPGPVDTEMISGNIGTPEGRASSISRIPLGRIAVAEDIASGALFLASDESSFMTGAELIIDGGYTAQ